MFPFSVTGRMPLAAQNDAQVLAAVQAMLDGEGARVSAIVGDAVTFQNDLFRQGGRGSLIGPYDRGEIRIVRQDGRAWLTYDNSLRRILGLVTVFAVLAGLFQLLFGGTLVAGAIISAVLWLWLLGPNYLIAASRFRDRLSHAI